MNVTGVKMQTDQNKNKKSLKKNRTKLIFLHLFGQFFFSNESVWFAVCVFEAKPNRNTYTHTYITSVLRVLCVYYLSFTIFCSVMYKKLIQCMLLSFSYDFF